MLRGCYYCSTAGTFKASTAILQAIDALQAIVQRDEGGRGIAALTRPQQLRSAAIELMAVLRQQQAHGSGSLVVLTGFPCMRERTPPGESDGPPGAACVARTLQALGGPTVRLPIEDHTEKALRACVEAACADEGGGTPEVIGFSPAERWTPADDARLDALHADAAAVVSIERAGPAGDGVCYTMRALPMGDALIAPRLNELARISDGLSAAPAAVPATQPRCIAIGDGGNELGLGALHTDICEHVKLGATIGCVVPAHAELVASVSNWGAYALSHALSLLAWDEGWGPCSLAASAGDLAPTFIFPWRPHL